MDTPCLCKIGMIIITCLCIKMFLDKAFDVYFFANVALCGASGVVFAFMLLSSFTSFREGEIPLTFILVAVFFIGQQVIQGIFVTDNISNMGHIVGGIVGGLLGYSMNVKSRYEK